MVSCARCPRTFEVANIATKVEFWCPHCKCRHVRLEDGWYDEVVQEMRARADHEE